MTSAYLLPNDQTDAAYNAVPWVYDPVSNLPPPGLETTVGASQAPPTISTAQGIWDTIKSDSEAAGSAVLGGVEAGYGLVKKGVSTVVGDVAAPIQGALTSTYWYAIIAVVVLGGALYFMGKGGGVKVNI
jgi:hypothetical protein